MGGVKKQKDCDGHLRVGKKRGKNEESKVKRGGVNQKVHFLLQNYF